MGTPVVAIIGAGASHVSGRFATDRRPPLTTQLFRTREALDLLRLYTLAQAAGTAIERHIKANDTVAFEAALKALQEDGYAHHKQMALAVPPYLQALLLRFSELHRAESHRYGVLVDELLKLPSKVLFVSLNYDTLLDNHLAAFSRLDSLQSYLDAPFGWSLIKPHGSVSWYIDQATEFDPKTPPADLMLREQPIECVPADEFRLQLVRGAHEDHGRTSRYPAIALPDGPKDRLVLPTSHLQHLQNTLTDANEIDVLVLGYSALDTEILALIKRAGCRVRRLTVVNASPIHNLEVFERIRASGIEPIWPDAFDGSYEDWIDRDAVATWVAEHDKKFLSAVEPAELKRRIEVAEYEAAQRSKRPSILDQPL